MLTAGARAGGRDAAGQPAGQLVGRGIGGLAQGLHAAGGILGGGRRFARDPHLADHLAILQQHGLHRHMADAGLPVGGEDLLERQRDLHLRQARAHAGAQHRPLVRQALDQALAHQLFLAGALAQRERA